MKLTKKIFALALSTAAALVCFESRASQKIFATEPFVREAHAAARAYADNVASTKASVSDVAMAVSALVPVSQKGAANGVATLAADGRVPAAQLPAVAANDADLVHKGGAETITGAKTFIGPVIVPAQPLP
jgi:hypothetical protein